MDKEEAVKTLTKELGDRFGRQVVIEEVYKERLVKNASYVYQVDNPVLVDFAHGCYSHEGISINGRDMKNLLDILLRKNSSFTEANYIFLGNTPGGEKAFTDTRFIATAYSLIGEEETSNLGKNFYKNVSLDVLSAMDRLGIKNFARIYQLYTDAKQFDLEAKLAKEFIILVSRLKYDSDNETSIGHFDFLGGLDKLNDSFKKMGVTKTLSTTEDRKSSVKSYPTLIHKNNISNVVEELKIRKNLENSLFNELIFDFDKHFLDEFFNFVFFLPYEDQNIEVNKNILKFHTDQVDYVGIMVKDYAGGNNFEEYFDCLDGERQKRVVLALKTVSEKKPVYDSFLWLKGFKELRLDYLEAYKNNGKNFIEYFDSRNIQEKKVILKDVMNCDFTNDEVVEWLNRNHLDLLREVGFNG